MNEKINNLMTGIYNLKKTKEEKEATAAALSTEISNLDTEIETKSAELLAEVKAAGITEYSFENLFVNKFERENVGYKSEADVLKYLKENYNGQYIKVKTTESLDKNPLKAAIKADSVLAKALEDMTVKTVTEYVVVTDADNHIKMLEHIEKGKK